MKLLITKQEEMILIKLLFNEELKLVRNITTATKGAPHSRANLVLVKTLTRKITGYTQSPLRDRCSICGKEESEDDLYYSKTFPYGLCKTCYLNSTAK